jgi:hypothetical protein
MAEIHYDINVLDNAFIFQQPSNFIREIQRCFPNTDFSKLPPYNRQDFPSLFSYEIFPLNNKIIDLADYIITQRFNDYLEFEARLNTRENPTSCEAFISQNLLRAVRLNFVEKAPALTPLLEAGGFISQERDQHHYEGTLFPVYEIDYPTRYGKIVGDFNTIAIDQEDNNGTKRSVLFANGLIDDEVFLPALKMIGLLADAPSFDPIPEEDMPLLRAIHQNITLKLPPHKDDDNPYSGPL